MEAVSERSARYMTLVEAARTGWQDEIRARRTPDQGIRSRSSCDTIIDRAIRNVAEASLKAETDYTTANAADLRTAVKTHIDSQLAATQDRGWRLGE